MSQQDGKRNSESIASKLIAAGFPADLDGLRYNAALNIWEFAPFGGGGGATVTRQRAELSADFVTSSGSFVDIDNGAGDDLIITLANRAGGFFIAVAVFGHTNSGSGQDSIFRFQKGATNENPIADSGTTARDRVATLAFTGLLDGDVLTCQVRVTGGIATVKGAGDSFSHLEVFEVS